MVPYYHSSVPADGNQIQPSFSHDLLFSNVCHFTKNNSLGAVRILLMKWTG